MRRAIQRRTLYIATTSPPESDEAPLPLHLRDRAIETYLWRSKYRQAARTRTYPIVTPPGLLASGPMSMSEYRFSNLKYVTGCLYYLA